MSKLRHLKKDFGDECIATWDRLAPAEVDFARSRFDEVFGRGGVMAFRINGPGDTEPLTEFDSAAEEILLVPAIQGGAPINFDFCFGEPLNKRVNFWVNDLAVGTIFECLLEKEELEILIKAASEALDKM